MTEPSGKNRPVDDVRVEPVAYLVTRLPDDSPDQGVWSVRVEARGKGRWAVVNVGSCLNKQGEWEYEPIPSSRTDEWLDTVRWDFLTDAIEAAVQAEKALVVNGLTSSDVLARTVANGSRGARS